MSLVVLTSRDSFLERSLKAKEVETLNLISEDEEENLAADEWNKMCARST